MADDAKPNAQVQADENLADQAVDNTPAAQAVGNVSFQSSSSAAVASATSVSPPQAPVSATFLSPIVNAGLQLAHHVLWIASGSIVLVLGYLVVMDVTVGKDISGIYRPDLAVSHTGTGLYTLSRLEQFSHDIGLAEKDPKFIAPGDSIANAKGIIASLALLPGVTTAQTDQLNECVALISTTATDRNTKLTNCDDLLESTRKDALGAATMASTLQMASESATKLNEHRQSLHQFWLQAAQLILLNLLLPVLTAILGYTFGTQQSQKSS